MDTPLEVAARSRIARGSRVSGSPPRWWDGRPVEGWPEAHYCGTVVETLEISGLPYARVKWASGRKDLALLDRLYHLEEVVR